MKIEIKMTETVEEIIDRIIEEEGTFSYEYAVVSHSSVARVIIGGDMLQMDLDGSWNHKGVKYLHIYFDVYVDDDDEAMTFWVEKYVSVGKAFALAMNHAMSCAIGAEEKEVL